MGLWADTVLPTATRVGGVRLYPVTIGHAVLLQRLGNGFAQAVPTSCAWADVILSAWVCSRDWRQAVLEVGGLRQRWWVVIRAALWRRQVTPITLEMLAYHEAQWRSPEVEYRQSRRSERGTEHLHALYLHRIRQMHEDHETALGVPVSRALIDCLADAEREGSLTICGPKLDRLQALAAEHAEWDRQLRSGAARN